MNDIMNIMGIIGTVVGIAGLIIGILSYRLTIKTFKLAGSIDDAVRKQILSANLKKLKPVLKSLINKLDDIIHNQTDYKLTRRPVVLFIELVQRLNYYHILFPLRYQQELLEAEKLIDKLVSENPVDGVYDEKYLNDFLKYYYDFNSLLDEVLK